MKHEICITDSVIVLFGSAYVDCVEGLQKTDCVRKYEAIFSFQISRIDK